MPYFYNNDAKYSEAWRTLDSVRDWTADDIVNLSLWFRGNPPYVGSFTEDPAGIYTITSTGTDIWAGSDEFHFAFKEAGGTVKIIAKVDSLQNTQEFAKAGVMIRDTLDADSKYVGVFITPENGVRFQYRNDVGAVTEREFVEGVTAPQWVRLERTSGGLVRAYYSADGTTWERFSLVQVSMTMPVYAGLAVTSHDINLTCEAVFSQVSFPDTTVGEQWTVPAHECVQSAELLHERFAGAQRQVVGVGQDDLGARDADLLGRHRLDGAVGAHGHEGGRVERAVGGGEGPRACSPAAPLQAEAEGGGRLRHGPILADGKRGPGGAG